MPREREKTEASSLRFKDQDLKGLQKVGRGIKQILTYLEAMREPSVHRKASAQKSNEHVPTTV